LVDIDAVPPLARGLCGSARDRSKLNSYRPFLGLPAAD